MQIKRYYEENKNLMIIFFTSETVFLYTLFRYFPEILLKNIFYIILVNLFFLIYIPLISFFRIKYELEKEYPFFIAFMYSLSFVSTSRKRLFEIAMEAKEFGYITKILKKIYDLAIKFRLGFAEAVRMVHKVIPKGNFKEFLDRFSSALEVGEDLTDFFDREFNLALDNYEVAYKRSLENIRLLQDLYVSFMSSLAFALVILLILPFLVGIKIINLLGYFILIFLLANILVLFLSRYLIIEDKLLHDLKEKPKEYVNIIVLFSILSLVSVILLLILNKKLPLLPSIAISITPLAYVSYRTLLFENEVRKKEDQFPMFLSTLSGLSEVMGSSHTKIIDAIRIHDFKELNKHIENLYKRITLSYDYFRSWYYFAAEIGSKLIAKTILIFSRAIELGGDAKKIGEKLTQLFTKILDMRKLKSQFLSNTRGMFYGGFIAFSAILYVSIEILKLLKNLFESITALVGSDIFATIGLQFFTIAVNIELLKTIIDILVILQAFFVAMVIKNIDGGSKFGMFIDLAILLWIASFLAYGISYFFATFFKISP